MPYKDLRQSRSSVTSDTMRERIAGARKQQAARYANEPLLTNSELTGRWLEKHCRLNDREHGFLEQAVKRLGLSARAYTRILRIARTIADLEDSRDLNTGHLAEAINLRTLDRQTG